MGEDVIVPIFGMLTGIVIVGMVVMGPAGRAVGNAITYWLAGGRKAQGALPSAELDEVHERLDAQQQQLSELAERQDFTERLLAQGRDKGALAGGGER